MIKVITERIMTVPLTYKGIIEQCTIQDYQEWVKDKKVLGCDTESEVQSKNFDGMLDILSIQIGDTQDQYMFDFKSLRGYQVDIIAETLGDPDKIKIWHNSKHDINVIKRSGIETQKSYYCTQLAEQIYDGGLTRSKGWLQLASCLSRYFNVSTDKSFRHLFNYDNILDIRSILYATGDVKYLIPFRRLQLDRLIAEGSAKENCQDLYTVLGLENRSVFAFAEMEYIGIGVDLSKLEPLKQKVDAKLVEIVNELNAIVLGDNVLSKYYQPEATLFGDSFSFKWGSHKEKLALLKKIFPNIASTAKTVLPAYEDQHVIIPKLLEWSDWDSLRSKFLNALPKHINKTTGKIHVSIWQILSTGRISMAKPNLQQVSSKHELAKDLRAIFISDFGRWFNISDYSGCELRIIANNSKDPLWLELLRDPKADLHGTLCSIIFKIPIEKVREVSPHGGMTYRDIQKTIDFGLAYGMGIRKLARTLQISLSEAQDIVDKFFETCPDVKIFLDMIGKLGRERRYVRTAAPYGRIRKFDGHNPRWSKFKIRQHLEAIERKAKNHPFQGGNADIIKLALVYIYERRHEYNLDIRLILQIHDEIITDSPDKDQDEVNAFIKKQMMEAGKVCVPLVPMVCEPKSSKVWIK